MIEDKNGHGDCCFLAKSHVNFSRIMFGKSHIGQARMPRLRDWTSFCTQAVLNLDT